MSIFARFPQKKVEDIGGPDPPPLNFVDVCSVLVTKAC